MSNTNFNDKYIQDGKTLIDFELSDIRKVTFESPSNIALIKYWGKYGDQIPQNPSLSFTLKNSKTITKVFYQKAKNTSLNIEYLFENQRNLIFEEKIKNYLIKISAYLPFIKKLDFKIYSHNTFPHSAGIASSASSYSALALCLCTIEKDLFHTLNCNEDFYSKASFLARLGSGSSCRSLFGKIVLWGKTDLINGSTNELALPIDQMVHDVFKSYYDSILVIDSGEKAISSSTGHRLMQDHPFAEARYKQALDNLNKIINALKNGDEIEFAQIVENEAFTLHALMLSSIPSKSLIKSNTLTVISKLVEFRIKSNLNFTFTLDAGPNIHILYPQKTRNHIIDFINQELKVFCENERWIDDKVSDAPSLVEVTKI